MQEALKVIKRELGPEAIILSTKHIKSGFGLMSKASVEVTAAIAEKDLKKKQAAEKNLPQNVKEKIWNGKASKQAEIYNDYFEKQLRKAGRDTVELGSKARPPVIQPRQEAAPQPRPQVSPEGREAAPVAPRERRYIDIEETEEGGVDKYESPAYARSEAAASSSAHVKNLQADIEDRKSTRLNSSHSQQSRMPSSA